MYTAIHPTLQNDVTRDDGKYQTCGVNFNIITAYSLVHVPIVPHICSLLRFAFKQTIALYPPTNTTEPRANPCVRLTVTHDNITMPTPRNSLRGFLAQAKSALRAAVDSNQKITFVIGNESAGKAHHTTYLSHN